MHRNESPDDRAAWGPVSQSACAARVTFLDGLRGITAFVVVLHHAVAELPRDALKRPLANATQFLWDHGHHCVGVFIVLSGFSLMLPVVRSADGRLRGGVWPYFKRRARRILPPYYAALVLALALIALIPPLRHATGGRWDVALPAFDARVILSHVFLIHNLHPDTAFRIDPPMWSIATEWQIYFLFPLFLVIWRKFGISAVVMAGFLIGFLIGFLSGSAVSTSGQSLSTLLNPWFVGLFTLGMATAVLTEPTRHRSEHWGDRDLTFFVVGIILVAMFAPPIMRSDVFVGLAAAGLIAHCVRSVRQGEMRAERPRLLQVLESGPVVAVGGFSYSLYLTHFPLLSLSHAVLRGCGLDPNVRLIVLLLVASPLCVAAAWVFSLVFERPFLSKSARGAVSSSLLLRHVHQQAESDGQGTERTRVVTA